MRLLRSKRGGVLALALVFLALFLIRPGANRLRARLANSMSVALGRPVDVASVHLRLLPRPGFDLENFVVHDDVNFSAEPLLRAEEVTASLRLSSLFRGRLEVARLSLTEPSLNLVRNTEGKWNLEGLLQRAAETPVAPTSKARAERRPGFPYIEADRARINVKFGQEKKPYALTDAEFTLWQESEDSWGMRLKAQPVRTDLNLSDTGTVLLTGSWGRAVRLRETPLQFHVQWNRAQLGQASKLVYGADQGWRGTVAVSGNLTGTPGDLTADISSAIKDFRRYDLVASGPMRLSAHCIAELNSAAGALSKFSCQSPVASGSLAVTGKLAGWPASYDLAANAKDIPVASLIWLASHVNKNVPSDLAAAGTLNAAFQFQRTEKRAQPLVVWSGSGEATNIRLSSPRNKTELALDAIPFSTSSADSGQDKRTGRSAANSAASKGLADFTVVAGPVKLALGKASPLILRGWFSRSQYRVAIQGDARLPRLLQLARTVGVPALQSATEGTAKVDLNLTGSWSAFAAPNLLGEAQLQAVQAEILGLNDPLEIASAKINLTPAGAYVSKLTASVAGSTWHGTLTIPRQPLLSPSPIQFALHTDDFAADAIAALIEAHSGAQPWYDIFAARPVPHVPFLASLHAEGTVSVDRMLVHTLIAKRVSAAIELQNGRLRVSDLHATVLDGEHFGDWQADFTLKPPHYSGSGTLKAVELGELANIMPDSGVRGAASAAYHLTASGWTVAEILASADASAQLEVVGGALPHLVLTNNGEPLSIRRFAGSLSFQKGRLALEEGKLETSQGIYQISGTASPDRGLNLRLRRDDGTGFNITGALKEPHATATSTPPTQAALKP